ncbi:MAG: potassium-transporting ATPase subunit KdpC [bacterium]
MKYVLPSIRFLIVMTLVTGLLYPFFVTAAAQILFPRQANGSLIVENGRVTGSELIGQAFQNPRYFWSRLSATAGHPYNAGSSSGTNYGPLHPDLFLQARARIAELKKYPHDPTMPIPVDLVTASGSGLDPHICTAAAYYQVPRVAQARNLREETIREIVSRTVENRQLGFLGEPVVNVVQLNRRLDREAPVHK